LPSDICVPLGLVVAASLLSLSSALRLATDPPPLLEIKSMTTKSLFLAACLAFGLIYSPAANLSAQDPAENADDSVQMVIRYGPGQEKRRHSRQGVMEPVGLAVGQRVGITLQFLPQRAGELVLVTPLDGGEINLEGPVAVSPEGRVSFQFRSGRTAGLYRLAVSGAEQCQLSLYAVDPDRPPHGPQN
jgi:hypothetical protein